MADGPPVRTIRALLRIALPQREDIDGLCASLSSITLAELSTALDEGRPHALSLLEANAISKLGDRQQITNSLAKVGRAGRLKPYLAEADAVSSGLADGSCLPFPFAEQASSLMVNAMKLKELGNGAFKAGKNAAAVDYYSDAMHAAQAAAVADAGRQQQAANAALVALGANSAAAYLKLERWTDAAAAASTTLALEATHAKALYRRGMAQWRLKNRADARKDLVQCIKLDAQNREAREALKSLDEEKAADKAAFKEAFKETVARGAAEDAPPPTSAMAAAAAAKDAYAREMRERARREGVDLDSYDRLRDGLAAEGVDVSSVDALNAALRERGVEPNDQEEVATFAKTYAKANPGYGGVSWGASMNAADDGDGDDDGVVDISTDSMYSMSSWKGGGQ